MIKGILVSRGFKSVTSNGHELNYKFETFQNFLNDTDVVNRYLKEVYEKGIPEYDVFERCSKVTAPLGKEIKVESDLVELAQLANYEGMRNKQHEVVQQYLLFNDPHTIATELPLYMSLMETPNERNWQGHLDILRIYKGKIQIVDFKPKADKEKNAGAQLRRYALMFQKRTQISWGDISMLYFDNKSAYSVFF